MKFINWYNNTIGKWQEMLAVRLFWWQYDKDAIYSIEGCNWYMFYASDTKRWVFADKQKEN